MKTAAPYRSLLPGLCPSSPPLTPRDVLHLSRNATFVRFICVFWVMCCVSRFRLFVTSCLTVARQLLCPWDPPGKNTGVGRHFLLQGIFPTHRSNPGLPHCRRIPCYLKRLQEKREEKGSGYPETNLLSLPIRAR